MRLVEKKAGNGVRVDNDALLNYLSLGKQNGALSGFSITYSNGSIYASKGRLAVQGFTLEVTDDIEEIIDLTSVSIEDTAVRCLYLKVDYDSSEYDSSYSWVIDLYSKNGSLSKNEIQTGITGSYYYPVATFVKSGATVSNFTSLVKAISVNGGTSTGYNSVPQPVLSIVCAKLGRTSTHFNLIENGYVMIGNAMDYTALSESYTVKFEFYRGLRQARYRSGTVGNNKLWTRKTQWIKSDAMSDVVYTSLTNPQISGGDAPYKKAICTIMDVINRFFYDDLYGYNHTNGAIVLGTTLAENVRATRSKIRKSSNTHSAHIKHNFVKFAYKVALYNTTGAKIGESALSNAITIKPDTSGTYAWFIVEEGK